MSAGSQHPATIAVSAGRPHGIGEPLNHPITLASNFRGEEGVYSRTHGTPGWIGLEEAVGALEGGRAVSFSSGMAAAAALFLAARSGSYITGEALLVDGGAFARAL